MSKQEVAAALTDVYAGVIRATLMADLLNQHSSERMFNARLAMLNGLLDELRQDVVEMMEKM